MYNVGIVLGIESNKDLILGYFEMLDLKTFSHQNLN